MNVMSTEMNSSVPETLECAAFGCKEISKHHAMVNLIPNLKDGIPFCDRCYEEHSPLCDSIIEICKDIKDMALCPFSDEWYEGIISEMSEEPNSTITNSMMVTECGFLESRLHNLILVLDENFKGMEHLVKAENKAHQDYICADCH